MHSIGFYVSVGLQIYVLSRVVNGDAILSHAVVIECCARQDLSILEYTESGT